MKAGKDKDTALQLAQIAYLNEELKAMDKRTHPRYWAAFTHTGNWRPLPQKRNYIWWGLGGLGVIGFLVWWGLKTRR